MAAAFCPARVPRSRHIESVREPGTVAAGRWAGRRLRASGRVLRARTARRGSHQPGRARTSPGTAQPVHVAALVVRLPVLSRRAQRLDAHHEVELRPRLFDRVLVPRTLRCRLMTGGLKKSAVARSQLGAIARADALRGRVGEVEVFPRLALALVDGVSRDAAAGHRSLEGLP